jgi:hypothetical protein
MDERPRFVARLLDGEVMGEVCRARHDPRRRSRSRDGERGGLDGEIAVPGYRGVLHIDDSRTPSPRTGRLEPEQRPGWQGPALAPSGWRGWHPGANRFTSNRFAGSQPYYRRSPDELSEEEEMSFTRIEDAAVAFRNAQ